MTSAAKRPLAHAAPPPHPPRLECQRLTTGLGGRRRPEAFPFQRGQAFGMRRSTRHSEFPFPYCRKDCIRGHSETGFPESFLSVIFRGPNSHHYPRASACCQLSLQKFSDCFDWAFGAVLEIGLRPFSTAGASRVAEVPSASLVSSYELVNFWMAHL